MDRDLSRGLLYPPFQQQDPDIYSFTIAEIVPYAS